MGQYVRRHTWRQLLEVDTLGIAKVHNLSCKGSDADVWREVLSKLPQGFDLIPGTSLPAQAQGSALASKTLRSPSRHATKTYTLVCGTARLG
jgi:hypothetical protein